MINIHSLNQKELADQLISLGQPSFRARQIWNWVYNKGADSFDDMSNLPQTLRASLKEGFVMRNLKATEEQHSEDGTRKRLYDLGDGQLIESVLMSYQDGRRTACISSQAGCAMACVFCATGQMGFSRNLKAHEIFEQAFLFSKELSAKGERLSNVVLMGMGEPFHNYDATLKAVRMIMDRLDIGARRITISTVGLAKQIRRFANEGLQVKLAISLHSTQDEARSRMMPINRRYNIATLLEACRYYIEKTSRRISFEWALIAGENDQPEIAHQLGASLRGLKCHVNLIPLNQTGGYGGEPSDSDAVNRFINILGDCGIPATLRVRRGIDIDAGCGQLKSKALTKGKTNRV